MVPYSVRLCGCTKVDKEAEILSVTILVDTIECPRRLRQRGSKAVKGV